MPLMHIACCICSYVRVADYTAGRELHPAPKNFSIFECYYNPISEFLQVLFICFEYNIPIDRITKFVYDFVIKWGSNGKGDLAVMSIEAYEELTSRFELYSQINLKKPTAAGHLPDVATEQLTLRYAAKVLSCRWPCFGKLGI